MNHSLKLIIAVVALASIVSGAAVAPRTVDDRSAISSLDRGATSDIDIPGDSGHEPAGQVLSSPDEFSEQVQPFLKKYCFECHSGDDAEAGIDFSQFETQADVLDEQETWETAVEAIENDYMPPDKATQPARDEVIAVKDWFKRTVIRDAELATTPGVMRRLNRTEYENTVRDLLRLKVDVFDNPARITITDDYFQPATRRMPRYVLAMSHQTYGRRKPAELPGISELPVDPPVAHGFSNDQSALSFSPVYLEASLAIADSLVSDANFPRQSRLWNSLFVLDAESTTAEQIATARKRFESFLRRAFRRPATETEIERYTGLFERELGAGNFTTAMQSVVTAVLASPSFLFRRDHVDTGATGAGVDPYAMASRLSYFLWASMPDDELFQAAAEDRLRTDADLDYQVRRMMADRRVKSLATDFGMQWLKVARLYSARPDKDLFPNWYLVDGDSPGISMAIEQLLLFETILVEDRSILEFVQADYAYLNRPLMDWYFVNPAEALGYTPPQDAYEDFFRIKWPNLHRGGAITSGAMLVSTSATTRTSPVYRGAWVLEVIFNRPPPPPPPEVPALEAVEVPGHSPKNVRERLEQHRLNPTCAVCHDRIDPLGFALEKFDPLGRFRPDYGQNVPIDATGNLYGEEFDGAARFKNVILRQKERFVIGFVEHVAQYALGRQLRASDQEEIERIASRVADRDYRFSAVIREIVLSDLFRSTVEN